MKILVVEDDMYIGNLIETLLKDKYQVIRAYSGTEALLQLERESVQLVLLDLMLPGMSGEEVLEKIHKDTKVIILSAKDDKMSKINGLLAGANDYVTKPFDNEELLARIEVQLRELSASNENQEIYAGELHVDDKNRQAYVAGQELKLTRIEYDLLAFFMKHPNQVFSKNQIFEQVWEDIAVGNENLVKVHISNLRNKINQYTSENYIETIWGIGFRFVKK